MSAIRYLVSRLDSMGHALRGLGLLLVSEPNARIHGAATVAVCAAGFYFGVTGMDWRWLTLAISAVWAAEAINTALELLADAVSPDHHPLIGKAKDAAAAAVLVAAIAASVIGGLVFWPYLATRAGG